MDDRYAFIDEFGDPGLDFSKPNVSTHFIVGAVLLSGSGIAETETELIRIQTKYFQGSEMKSVRVGKKDDRRMKVLKELAKLQFRILAVVVDKRKLTGQGFRYSASFYKYIHNLVDNELYRACPSLKIYSDCYRDTEFMNGFKAYIVRKHPPDLFNSRTFEFVESGSSLLIQASDIICGSIARNYDETVKSKRGRDFIDILKRQIIRIVEWPPDRTTYSHDLHEAGYVFNDRIAQAAFAVALEYVERCKGSQDPNRLDRMRTLEYLLLNFNLNPYRFVLSTEIIERLNVDRNEPMKKDHFRTEVIAKLRDDGILISSSGKGYKIPATEADCYSFVNMDNKVIEPMLRRLKRFRDRIRLATYGELDILDQDEYKTLKRILDTDE